MATETANKKEPDCGKDIPCKPLTIDGDVYYTRYTKKYENRKTWEKHDPKKIISFIPGTIKEVLIKEGDKVSEGDKLIVFEAMKMSNTIFSPMDGTIKQVCINVDDIVPKDSLLIEFE
ncbi:MAG: acetyl-CoA carboxylase biotin carboxyl carrier protein subunit [Bacteroidales bacterium]|nr:acetyl-CoA carboxylase biotin carboxyl carrier protein subunit [Bacteroidales bacterium]